jgi:acylpyruvate hydrolase
MKLVTIDNSVNGCSGAVLQSGEILHFGKTADFHSLETWIPDSTRAILEAGKSGLSLVSQMVDRIENVSDSKRDQLRERGAITSSRTRLLTPIPNPRLIVAAGLAFKSHLAEMSGTPTPANPTAFMKSVNSIVGSDSAIRMPPDASTCIDYEGELAVVFGRTCHAVHANEAMSYVAGYMAANDVSARDWVKPVWEAKEAWPARQTWEVNIMGKQFESFTPLGPVLTTADDVPDAAALQLTTRLNGTVMQNAFISDLIFSLTETIAYFSKWYTFRPGDILLTGTPAGVGVGRKPAVFMKAGDVIEVEVSHIGTLRNTLVA